MIAIALSFVLQLQDTKPPEVFDPTARVLGHETPKKFEDRAEGYKKLKQARGKKIRDLLDDGLEWLAEHQSEDGCWDCEGFTDVCRREPGTTCLAGGSQLYDVGVTGLAMLALMGAGNTPHEGPHKKTVARATKWLFDQQDPATGLIGARISHEYLYGHAIATAALAEAYHATASPFLLRSVESAIDYLLKGRNPGGGWRYEVPPTGESDTSVTAWAIQAIVAARDAGIEIESSVDEDLIAFLDEMTSVKEGRVGYNYPGQGSSRITGINDHYPRDVAEALTAAGLYSRFLLGQFPGEVPVMKLHRDLIEDKQPRFDPEGLENDLYYWYYGSQAMFQVGGEWWEQWRESIDGAFLESQGKKKHLKGTIAPDGPWGFAGGGVYSTAVLCLCLESGFRILL